MRKTFMCVRIRQKKIFKKNKENYDESGMHNQIGVEVGPFFWKKFPNIVQGKLTTEEFLKYFISIIISSFS